jgi:hypothetical protein
VRPGHLRLVPKAEKPSPIARSDLPPKISLYLPLFSIGIEDWHSFTRTITGGRQGIYYIHEHFMVCHVHSLENYCKSSGTTQAYPSSEQVSNGSAASLQ